MYAERRGQRALVKLVLILAGGCAGTRATDRGVVPTPSPHPYEESIPLPTGFVLVDQSSEDWSAGPLRYLRHRYRGRGDKHAVRTFYREQMPLVRWTAVDESSVHGRCTMSFRRRSESCTITIEGAGSKLFPYVTVDVLITPKAR